MVLKFTCMEVDEEGEQEESGKAEPVDEQTENEGEQELVKLSLQSS